mmetsp:Transcript_35880/g.44513  ORF Transcript_35880/g.44513 Transcript_35880/m.44513 type:complete len:322 (-) Transcript_35880:759-1724(-)|eukprot:CAMPEP_0204843884 /NCGR_PEP_ID=MMETSP1346-20131115/48241_1 /ASSEMBLY_ACC=CAM_ASM_000771 /TAXON_ID=215587 /ORGANISM="Aplanochytrium stocchinoi, Strain GSBS06" /LENGTH=321 /DNA_ID=CAMNT_0051983105 /DNA_START=76 /DNA_END=1041 /DNA_ORIENTATION=+
MTSTTKLLSHSEATLRPEEVANSVANYEKLYSKGSKEVGAISTSESIDGRKKDYENMVSSFYDLVTDFYEYGWGDSFHFAPRFKGESFKESILRAEYFLAMKLQLSQGQKVLDVGCGVGGPMRNIARFSKVDVTGVTINEYQIRVGNKYCIESQQESQCRLVQGDFQKLDENFLGESFDAAYAIESTCHSPDKVTTFKQVHLCLRKGGLFAGYEWVLLPERGYDGNNPEHVRIKEGIEVGNGLPTLATAAEVNEALVKAGFEVLESYDANIDVHKPDSIPWYDPLTGKLTLSGFRMTTAGRIVTHAFVSTLEFLRIAPRGN